VARYRIRETENALLIELTEVGEKQGQFLEAFGECQAGECSCPTDEYSKLAAMDVTGGGDSINVRLETRPGAKLETAQIVACLDFTTERLK
jgi:hypothetical protein